MNDESERPFSSVEALRFGWAATRAHLKPLLGIGVLGAFLALLHQVLAQPEGAGGLRQLLLMAVQVLQVGIAMAYTRAGLLLHDQKSIDGMRPADLLPDFFSFLITSILYGLIFATGLLLLVVPGVIWGLMFSYAGYLIVDQKADPIVALRESRRLTNGVKMRLLGFALLMGCVNLVGALAFGIGLLVTLPTSFVAGAYVLRRLQARAGAQLPPAPQPRSEELCKSVS